MLSARAECGEEGRVPKRANAHSGFHGRRSLIRDSARKVFLRMPGKASVARLPKMGSLVMAFVFDVWHNASDFWYRCL